jgi:hypothetical protein
MQFVDSSFIFQTASNTFSTRQTPERFVKINECGQFMSTGPNIPKKPGILPISGL